MNCIIDGMVITMKPSRGRYLRLKVDGATGDVFLYKPRNATKAQAEYFVLSKKEWILKAKSHVLMKNQAELLPEGKILLFGKVYNVVYLSSGKSCLKDDVAYVLTKATESEQREKALNLFCKKVLNDYLQASVPRIAESIGLYPSDISIRSMRTRWGSCNVKTGKITFSLNLVKKDRALIDYVILHELAHLRYTDHGAMFKAFLSVNMPDWKKRKKLLNGV